MLVEYDPARLLELVREHALTFGDFTLASGARANFYLDCRKLTLTGEGANQVAAGMLQLMDEGMPQAVGGMAIGADPITAAIITRAWQEGHDLKGFIVRKESKGHGTGRQVEGPVVPGESAIIVEDVVTSGGSSLKAVEHARAFGLDVQRIIAIIDRQSGAAERFASAGIAFQALLTLEDLGIAPGG